MAGQLLVEQGHKVVLHARKEARADGARKALPKAEAIVIGDLETIGAAKDLAAKVNALGRFDAVIHDAAIGYREGFRLSADGLPHVFAINTLSAYILTALIEKPKRLVYLSSSMHHRADANFDDILWRKRSWNGPRPTPRASCMTPCSPSPSRGCGRMWCRTRSNPAGCRPRWGRPGRAR